MYTAIVFLPILGSAIAGIFGRIIGARGAELVTTGFLFVSAGLSCYALYDVAFLGHTYIVAVAPWIASGNLSVDWALRIDSLTAVMLVVVAGVSSLVHLYSVGYMHDDPHRPRFFSYLSLFTFAMLMLVTANNFLQMFFGWEGVGLASYLLIGFWYTRPAAVAAAIKAFIVNRIGDFGFALGVFGVYAVFGTLDFDRVFMAAPMFVGKSFVFAGHSVDILNTLCILLFIGAMGKSAQIGLHTWLPDAMEGPTPVSALIHAATMVTAGVFMVCRLSPMFEYAPTALAVVGVIGGTTAMFAASVGMVQNDIKRVVAWSTCSQLGYMFAAAAVSAYAAAIFHLFAHAFFKGLLFLCSGSVIHAMGGEQDMRRMGGLWRKIPWTYGTMWVGALSLSGIPFFSGYYSKDTILEATWVAGTAVGRYGWCLGTLAAFMTAFYISRVMFMTFHGEPRADEETMHHAHESPWVMLIPLLVLAAGATFLGYVGYDFFVGDERASFWRSSILVLPQYDSLAVAEHVPPLVRYLPLIFALVGIGLAYLFYIL